MTIDPGNCGRKLCITLWALKRNCLQEIVLEYTEYRLLLHEGCSGLSGRRAWDLRADGAEGARRRRRHSMHVFNCPASRLFHDGVFKDRDPERRRIANGGLDDKAAQVPSRRRRRGRVGRQPGMGKDRCTFPCVDPSPFDETHFRASISSFKALISSA